MRLIRKPFIFFLMNCDWGKDHFFEKSVNFRKWRKENCEKETKEIRKLDPIKFKCLYFHLEYTSNEIIMHFNRHLKCELGNKKFGFYLNKKEKKNDITKFFCLFAFHSQTNNQPNHTHRLKKGTTGPMTAGKF